MIVSGTKELPASREAVWSVINEPSEMAKLMPGVESFEITDERHWTAKVKVPLGLGGLKMTMNFEKLEERAPEFASMRSKGQGVGALMDMTTSFTLSEAGEGTSMAWEADIKIAGPVGVNMMFTHSKARRIASRLLEIGLCVAFSKSAIVETLTPAEFARSSCDHCASARAACTSSGVNSTIMEIT